MVYRRVTRPSQIAILICHTRVLLYQFHIAQIPKRMGLSLQLAYGRNIQDSALAVEKLWAKKKPLTPNDFVSSHGLIHFFN